MAHHTLLVVEDDDAIRGLLMHYFREHADVDVDGARDGAEALHQVSTKPYDVVVLDLMMPHMSGIDFLTSLEALTSDPSVKAIERPPRVFVITAAPPDTISSNEIEQRFPSLVRGVMRKPIDVNALAARVEALL